MLKCAYINLDSAQARRAALESSFHAHATPGFELVRFAALDTVDVANLKFEGKARPNERACFLSHKQVILDHAADDPAALMVLEDDAEFGPSFFRSIGPILTGERNRWDLIFTDICVPDATLMVNLARKRSALGKRRQIAMVDLKDARFAGAAAYIINPASLRKVQDLLRPMARLDAPYDMYLRKWVREGTLRAGCVFPFLTTLSLHSEDSAIQPDDTIVADLVWNTFRKAMWADRDPADYEPRLQQIRDHVCDDESMLLAPIFCGLVSGKFTPK